MKKISLELEVSEEMWDSLKVMEAMGGFPNFKELTNTALTLLEWTIRELAEGNIIAVVNEKEEVFRELIMPFMKNIPTRE